jgi:hypothetical protein
LNPVLCLRQGLYLFNGLRDSVKIVSRVSFFPAPLPRLGFFFGIIRSNGSNSIYNERSTNGRVGNTDDVKVAFIKDKVIRVIGIPWSLENKAKAYASDSGNNFAAWLFSKSSERVIPQLLKQTDLGL